MSETKPTDSCPNCGETPMFRSVVHQCCDDVEKLREELRLTKMVLEQFTHCYFRCSNRSCRLCYAHPGPCDVDYCDPEVGHHATPHAGGRCVLR